jgi:hypothetical protein
MASEQTGGAYEVLPDGTRRRIGGTETPALPQPREADGTPIDQVKLVAPNLPELPPRTATTRRKGG